MTDIQSLPYADACMKIIARILITALALLIVAKLMPGVMVDGLYPAIIAAIVLGLMNAIVRPVLVVLTLPITIVTLGLFIFVINGLLFWFTASFLEGFAVAGFWSAVIGALLVSIISTVGNWLVK